MIEAEARPRPNDLEQPSEGGLIRAEAWFGEMRINLIRLAALVFFYAHHLSSVYVLKDDGMTPEARAAVTTLVLLWALVAVGIHFVLSQRRLPALLPYMSVGLDLLMIGLLVACVGGPKSPLLLLLFPVIASAPLRMSLGTVYVATLGGLTVYGAVLSWYVFGQVGAAVYYADQALRIPRSSQFVFVLCLLTGGFLAGQAVRQARRLLLSARPSRVR